LLYKQSTVEGLARPIDFVPLGVSRSRRGRVTNRRSRRKIYRLEDGANLKTLQWSRMEDGCLEIQFGSYIRKGGTDDGYLGRYSSSALLHRGVGPVLVSRDIPVTPSQSVNDFMLLLCTVIRTALLCTRIAESWPFLTEVLM